jgi:hypothetical protein
LPLKLTELPAWITDLSADTTATGLGWSVGAGGARVSGWLTKRKTGFASPETEWLWSSDTVTTAMKFPARV